MHLLKDFIKAFSVLALLAATNVNAQAFEGGTNAVGVYYQTYWWVKDGSIMEWQGLTNGGMVVWDYGVVDGAISVGLDVGFSWETHVNSAEFSVANYSLRGGFHPLSLPGVSGGDKHDLYGLIKLGVVSEWDRVNRVQKTADNRFQWSVAIGDRIFIGEQFFIGVELSIRGAALGLGLAF